MLLFCAKSVLRLFSFCQSFLFHHGQSFCKNCPATDIFPGNPLVVSFLGPTILFYIHAQKKASITCFFLIFFLQSLYFLSFNLVSFNLASPPKALVATKPESARSANTFGTTISWLNMSVSSQTRSFDRQEPRKMKATAITEYGTAAYWPNR